MKPYFSWKLILLGLGCWLLGVLYSWLSYREPVIPIGELPEVSFGEHPSFWGIFQNNFRVSLLILIGGYLSGGLLTGVIFLWNGYVLGDLILDCLKIGFSWQTIGSGLLHSPLEIFALLLFGAVGFRGFDFIRGILIQRPLPDRIRLLPLIIPGVILLLAALIEANL